MAEYNIKHFAHLGDSVYEVFIRLYVIDKTVSLKQMHNLTTKYVNANFQAAIYENILKDFLNENEKEIFKRGRNLTLSANKKNNPAIHRLATGFEVIVGYLYIKDKERLKSLFEIVKNFLISNA